MELTNSRINICWECDKYTEVPLFAEDPICPDCGKLSEQTTTEELKTKYWIGFLYQWSFCWGAWYKIGQARRVEHPFYDPAKDDLDNN